MSDNANNSNAENNEMETNYAEIIGEASDIIQKVNEQAVKAAQHAKSEIENNSLQPSEGSDNAGGGMLKAGNGGDNVSSYFTNLPIGQLISAPFIELAKGQAELCEVYIQTLFRIAYQDPDNAGFGSESQNNATRILKFTYDRLVQNGNGEMETKTFNINAPLLALVPIPAFLMDSADVEFQMEVNIANQQENETSAEVNASASFSFWKFNANLEGKVSSKSISSSSNTQKATYTISAHASQQAAAEGMSKLTALLAETMEPVENS